MPDKTAMNCPHCGSQLPPDASFCPYCARTVNERQELSPPALSWRRALRRALPILAVLLLLGGFVFGVTVNGMAGWVYFMGVAVSINLFWPLFAPLYGGILYQYRQEGMKGLGKCVAWMLPGLLVTALCARMGTALLLLEIDLILLGIAVGKGWFQVSKKKVLAGIGAGMAVIPAAAVLFAGIFGNGYQKLRLALLFGQAEGEMSWPKEVLREVLGGSRLVGTSASLQGQIQEFPAVDYVLTYVTGYFGILAALALLGLDVPVLREHAQRTAHGAARASEPAGELSLRGQERLVREGPVLDVPLEGAIDILKYRLGHESTYSNNLFSPVYPVGISN